MAKQKDTEYESTFYSIRHVHDAFNELLTPTQSLPFKLGGVEHVVHHHVYLNSRYYKRRFPCMVITMSDTTPEQWNKHKIFLDGLKKIMQLKKHQIVKDLVLFFITTPMKEAHLRELYKAFKDEKFESVSRIGQIYLNPMIIIKNYQIMEARCAKSGLLTSNARRHDIPVFAPISEPAHKRAISLLLQTAGNTNAS